MTDEEVSARFPEAKVTIDGNDVLPEAEIEFGEFVEPMYDIGIHEGGDNMWTTYRLEDYCREDCYLNIQMVTATPMNEDSILWFESNSTYDYFIDEVFPVTDNVISAGVSSLLGTVSPAGGTILSLFSAVAGGLYQDDHLEINKAVYVWEGRTIMNFAYVRYESEIDLQQQLVAVSNKFEVDVTISLDVDEYELIETGQLVPIPSLYSSRQEFQGTANRYESASRAAYVFLNYLNYPVDDVITYINVSPIEGNSFVIDIPCPRSPTYCDS